MALAKFGEAVVLTGKRHFVCPITEPAGVSALGQPATAGT